MKVKSVSQYIGFVLGVIYGLVFRLLSDTEYFDGFYDVYSITFIWVIPMLIGLFPIMFSSSKLYLSPFKLFVYPIITICLFLIVTVITKLEDVFCLLIIGIPFFITAGVVGMLLGTYMKDKIINKKVYSIFLLPLILNPVENVIPNKVEAFKVERSILINKNQATIFPDLLEVKTIDEKQYGNGFFQMIGIPKPLNSKTYQEKDHAYRIGYFTDDFKLYESVDEFRKNEFVSFQIHLDKSKLRDKPTDIHLVKSDYFKFGNISYSLIKVNDNTTKVVLSCSYTLNSKMNFYANFWAKTVIADFEERLLKSIKENIET